MSELNPLTQHPCNTGGHVVRKKKEKKDLHHKGRFKTTPTYQSPAAEEDHENDERFKPVVLHDDEAGFSECPPALEIGSLLVDLAAVESTHTACKHGWKHAKLRHLTLQTQIPLNRLFDPLVLT